MSLAQQGFCVINFFYHLAPVKKYPTSIEELSMYRSIEDDYAVVSIFTSILNRCHTVEKLMLETIIQNAEGMGSVKEKNPFVLYEQENRTIS